jgi:hypothetical protein
VLAFHYRSIFDIDVGQTSIGQTIHPAADQAFKMRVVARATGNTGVVSAKTPCSLGVHLMDLLSRIVSGCIYITPATLLHLGFNWKPPNMAPAWAASG